MGTNLQGERTNHPGTGHCGSIIIPIGFLGPSNCPVLRSMRARGWPGPAWPWGGGLGGAPQQGRGHPLALGIQPEEIEREKLLNDWRYGQHLKNDLKDRCGRWAEFRCSLPSTRAPNSVASGLDDTRVRLPPHRPAAAGTKGLEAASRLMVGGLTLSSLAISACVSPAAMRCNASSR